MSETAAITRRISLASDVDLLPLLGRNDDHLKTLESELDIRIVARGHDIMLKGDERQVKKAERALVQLAELVRAGTPLRAGEVRAALRMLSDDDQADLKSVFADAIAVPSRKKWVAPKSVNQKRYVDAIRSHDMVFAIGPAGTGKSFLAVAMAVAALMKREVARIVLTRPAVEAGERLGFLPGDLYEKVHPYLRPLYDALYDMLETERVTNFMEKGAIEIAPLAYMRPDSERLLHHPRRGAEQHRRADEDVPHSPRVQFEDGDHRRRDPGRPAGLARLRAHRSAVGASGRPGDPLRLLRRRRRGPAPARIGDRPGLRRARRPQGRARLRADHLLMSATVTNRQDRVAVSPARLARSVERALTAVGRGAGDVDLLVVDDAAIKRLNRLHRGVARRTDVLAYPLETPGTPSPLVGQIVISAETARRQARRLDVPLATELDLLVTHGVLHLIGYDDRDPVEARLMHERERRILSAGRRRPPDRLWRGLLDARPSRPRRARASLP